MQSKQTYICKSKQIHLQVPSTATCLPPQATPGQGTRLTTIPVIDHISIGTMFMIAIIVTLGDYCDNQISLQLEKFKKIVIFNPT